MRVGKQMQFFAARVNSAKALLYAINGGRDEMTGMQVIDKGVIEPITPEADGTLDYEKVKNNYEKALEWLSETYVMALNIIHYMHDKYAYESIEMALHDKEVYRHPRLRHVRSVHRRRLPRRRQVRQGLPDLQQGREDPGRPRVRVR